MTGGCDFWDWIDDELSARYRTIILALRNENRRLKIVLDETTTKMVQLQRQIDIRNAIEEVSHLEEN